jgi:LmbE family N-acetylglucosaminyl deacetylase
VSLVVCTKGDRGGHDLAVSADSLAGTRRAEQLEAAAILGVRQVIFLEHGDGELKADDALREEITKAIRQVKPDAVVAHDPAPYYVSVAGYTYIHHVDHKAAGQATLAAVYPCAPNPRFYPEHADLGLGPHRVAQVLLVDVAEPDFFVDIGATIEAKARSIAAHRTQAAVWGGQEALVREWARRMGQEAGMDYAEGFRRLRLSF